MAKKLGRHKHELYEPFKHRDIHSSGAAHITCKHWCTALKINLCVFVICAFVLVKHSFVRASGAAVKKLQWKAGHRLADLRSHPCFAFQCSVICAQITLIWCKASKNHFFGPAQFCSRLCCNKSSMQWSVDISWICAVTPGLVFQRNLCTEISDLIGIAEKLLQTIQTIKSRCN